MVVVMLTMIVGGIGLSQAISSPTQVTLRWLRLGGIIAVCLLAVAWTLSAVSDQQITPEQHGLMAAAVGLFFAQLIAVQLGKRSLQRVLALAGFGVSGAVVAQLELAQRLHETAAYSLTGGGQGIPWVIETYSQAWPVWLVSLTSSGILGGGLMAMLLGHAYLTAGGEMTQAPFRRLVWMLGGLLLVRGVLASGFGLWPFLMEANEPFHHGAHAWNTVMVTARYAVGLAVPGLFIYMVNDCVKRRANQSATGILYVMTVLVMLGEGIALALFGSTGYVF